MRGLTEAEVNTKAERLAAVAMDAIQRQQVAPQQSQAPAYTPPAADDYITGAALQQVGTQYLQQAQQMANPAIEMAASTNLEMVKQQYAKEFGKYGHEIMATLYRVPKTDWSIDNLRRVVKLSLVDHLDELANERAAQLTSSQDPALRSSGANGSITPSQAPLDGALTDAQKETLRRRGITESVVESFARAKGQTPQQWYEKAGKYGIGDAV